MTTNKVGQNKQVNLSQFHVGLKRSEAKTKEQASIFNALDKDKDGVLEKNEMQGVVQGKRKVNGKFVTEQFIKIKNLENGRSLVMDANGQQYVMAHDGILLKKDYVNNPDKYKKAIQQKQIQTRQNSEKLADEFYKIADENSGYSSMKKMQNLLNTKVNSKNITSFLDAYDREKTRKDDSSIIDTVTSEIGAGGSQEQRNVLMTIMNKLCEAAKNAGVSDENIKKAYKDFETSLNKEFAAKARRTNPKDMEKALDYLRGEIAAKQTANVNKMSTKDAIKSFNASFIKENNSAQSAYNGVKGEGWSWSAKMGDTVCGWFGCNTIEEMEKKLGANAKAVKSLVSAKTEAEFKTRYKQVFGIEFDPQKIAAAEASQGNYIMAQGLSQGIKVYNKLLSNANNQTLSQFENSAKSTLKLNDEQFALFQKTVYANCKTDAEKKQALTLHMRNAQGQLSSQYNNLTKGKTLEQMGKDCELIAKSAFGTNDISKDVAQFTDNMATTEMIADITGDIVLTVAVSAIPGGAAWGTAKLAASAAKWGAKGAKVAKVLTKTANAFEKVKKFEQGTQYAKKAAQGSKTAKAANITSKTVSSAGNAALGTAIYETAATNHSAEEIKNKCLTNGIYGAIGAGASELAPRLMQAFKINSSLANEIAEEIINAAGSLGVETVKGGEYGTTDATIDIVSGILMARFSHIGGGGKVHTNTPDVPSAKTKPSLSESDKLTKSQNPLDNGVVFSQRIIKDLDNPKVQGQVGDYMDNLLESVPTQKSKIKGSIELEADYLLPDGTLIARKSTGDTGELVWDEVTQKYKLKENESALAFWIRDPDGNEHMLTATTAENREKAQQLINYCSTQEPIPRSQIDAVQKQHLDNLKSKNTQNSTSDTKIDNESKIMLDADGMPLAGDVAMGAAQEYAKTGQITATGVATNAVMSGVGSAVTSGVLNKGYKAVKKSFGNVADNVSQRFSAKKADLHSISTPDISSNVTGAKNSTQVSARDILEAGMNPEYPIVGGYSTNKGAMQIPHNAEIIPVSDNLSVMRTDSGLSIYMNGKSYPSKICKLELGESRIIGKDATGNNLVAMRDNTGNISVSVEKPHTELNLTKSQTTTSAPVNHKISTKVPVQELPIRENIEFGDNKVVRRINENDVTITTRGKIPEKFTIEPGTRKIITDKYGASYIVTHNSQTGKIHIQKKVDVDAQASLTAITNDNTSVPIRKQRTGVEPPQKTPVNKDTGELNVNSNKLIGDTPHTSPQELVALRNSNPVKYNQLTNEAISKLKRTSPAAYNRLEEAGIITALNADPNVSISPRLLKNIQLEAQGKTLVTQLPNGAKLSDISTHIDNGDVCSFGGRLYVNNNGKAERLNLSPEKFEHLFPPVESSIINQDINARDCWFLSQLGGQMESPSGRVNLYKRFRQEGNDIYVSYPNAPDVKFTDGRVVSAPGIQTQTCDGLKMIEMTQAVHRLSTTKEGRNVKFERLYEKGSIDAVDINSKLTPTKKHWYSASKAEMSVDDLLKRLSDGQTYTYLNSQNFRYKSWNKSYRDEIISVLEESANNPNISISFATDSFGGFRDSMLGGHGARITGYDGRYVYFNDQIQTGGSAVARKVPVESFFKNMRNITYTNFDPK